MKAPSQKTLLLIFSALLLLALLLLLLAPHGGVGAVEICQNGQLLYRLPATEQVQTLTIAAADGGYNVVSWSAAGAQVTAADCPDRLCVRRGLVAHGGLPIVCLPHRLSVEIVESGDSDDGGDLDAITGQ
ncbi:MAG: NusG domain II-containing protein [Bacillota bacterium]|nr:NusG domain II-containing protein [Bacillota bacterium]